MLGLKEMPQSASSMFTAYASLATTMMMIRSITNDLLPPKLISLITSIFLYFFPSKCPSKTTLVVEKKCEFLPNQMYQAAELYLGSKITPSMDRLKISKTPRQKKPALSMEKGQQITDHFEGITLTWRLVSVQNERDKGYTEEKCHYEVEFDKKFMERVIDSYFPYLLRTANEIKEMENVAKLCGSGCYDHESGGEKRRGHWGSIKLEHPATFDTLALDPDLKKMIVDDLDRFVRRKEFYRRVGKAWKRGYLLYGPPGTGKSSLIAAMANYLKFDIFDLDLSDIRSNNGLRNSLLSTTNRSILVIEDIDCTVHLHNRANVEEKLEQPRSGLTLSGMLNFMDGLWSSCGDERIVVFTTNHKDRLDPALLRPGRMDVHINLSYCSSKAFEVLATNYLGGGAISHRLYGEIEGLIDAAAVTPAEIAEELMKSDDVEAVMEGLVEFLKRKREERSVKSESPEKVEEGKDDEEEARRRKKTSPVVVVD